MTEHKHTKPVTPEQLTDQEFHNLASTWVGMIARCYRQSGRDFENYGKRGIKVCNRWRRFSNFVADMGVRPNKMSIDRVNVNGDYKPSNCKWSTPKEQVRNRRCTTYLTFRGQTLSLPAWAEKLGIKYMVLHHRIKNAKWSAERALSTPVGVEFNGRKQSLRAWSNETGIGYPCLVARVRKGWPIEKALTTPVQNRRRSKPKL